MTWADSAFPAASARGVPIPWRFRSLMAPDPNPMPRFRLFRWLPR